MRLLLDTHTFLWMLEGDARRLGPSTRELVDAADERWLSIASVWEAEIKRANGKLDVPPIAEAALNLGVPLLGITAEHTATAAHLPMHHRDPFDRLLIAQAQLEQLVLVSKDAVMRKYGVAVAW